MPNCCTDSSARNGLGAWSRQRPDNLFNWSSRPLAVRAKGVAVQKKIGSLVNGQYRPKRTFNMTSSFSSHNLFNHWHLLQAVTLFVANFQSAQGVRRDKDRDRLRQ